MAVSGDYGYKPLIIKRAKIPVEKPRVGGFDHPAYLKTAVVGCSPFRLRQA
jgi:hypothetical protein